MLTQTSLHTILQTHAAHTSLFHTKDTCRRSSLAVAACCSNYAWLDSLLYNGLMSLDTCHWILLTHSNSWLQRLEYRSKSCLTECFQNGCVNKDTFSGLIIFIYRFIIHSFVSKFKQAKCGLNF